MIFTSHLNAKLFKCLPKEIRNCTKCDVPVFKQLLDSFLSSIPDEPLTIGIIANKRADLNSLLHMVGCVDR